MEGTKAQPYDWKAQIYQFDWTKFASNLLTGGLAAAVSKTAAALIERVKLILQVWSILSRM